jgi:hypothetical protein
MILSPGELTFLVKGFVFFISIKEKNLISPSVKAAKSSAIFLIPGLSFLKPRIKSPLNFPANRLVNVPAKGKFATSAIPPKTAAWSEPRCGVAIKKMEEVDEAMLPKRIGLFCAITKA